MPVLPLIDLLILAGSFSLAVGFILKAISITTRLNPSILGFSAIDMVIIAGICVAFALALAARTWVKLNEPRLLSMRTRSAKRMRQALAEAAQEEQEEFDAAQAIRAEMR